MYLPWLYLLGLLAIHAPWQVEAEAKETLHQQWLDDQTRVIVATNAFGMGVHKPDVRLVVHWTMPDSIMALSQACVCV